MGENAQSTAAALLQAAAQGDQQAAQQLQQIMEIAAAVQQELQKMKSGKAQKTQKKGIRAEYGAKLDYLNKLKGICPEGTEKVYLEKGGCMCKKLKASEGAELKKKEQPKNEIQKFKAEKKACGSTLKKKK